MFISCLDRLE